MTAAPTAAARESAAVPPTPLPLYARAILVHPEQVEANLARIRAAGIVPLVPNSWQVFLGVMRMWYRILFHNEGIGTSQTMAVRTTRRARLLRWRALRLPCLLWEGSVVPHDLSGLASRPERLATHLLGTHHEGDTPLYDLRILSCVPGALERLRDAAERVVKEDTRRTRWLRDLCVYEGYHEELLAIIERALAGDWRASPTVDHTDTSLEEYLAWCASRPATPAATWAAWRRGELGLDDPAPGMGATGRARE